MLEKIEEAYKQKKPLEEIHEMYSECEDIDETDSNGRSLFHIAAGFADHQAVDILLERGGRAAVNDEDGRTPLHALTLHRPAKNISDEAAYLTALRLLDAGVSAIKKDDDGANAVYLAIHNGHFEINKAFIERGVNMSIPVYGQTMLYVITEMFKNASDHFSKWQKKALEEYEGIIAKYAPRLEEDKEKLSGIEALPESHEKEVRKRAVLHWINDSEKMIEEVKRGIEGDPETKAEMEHYFSIAQMLFESGLDPEEMSSSGMTAGELAHKASDQRLARLFSGGQIDGLALHIAVGAQNYDSMRELLAAGADPDKFFDERFEFHTYQHNTKNRITALATACNHFMDTEAIKILLEGKADPNLKDPAGRTALSYYGCNVNHQPSYDKLLKDKVPQKMLKLFMAHGLDINSTVDEEHNTLLHLLCKRLNNNNWDKNKVEEILIEELIHHSCDLDIADINGVTPLMTVCKKFYANKTSMGERVQAMLLENGARADLKDIHGNTALMYTASNYKDMAKTFAVMLFEFGDPLVNAVNNKGQTALEIAIEKKNDALAQLLVSKS